MSARGEILPQMLREYSEMNSPAERCEIMHQVASESNLVHILNAFKERFWEHLYFIHRGKNIIGLALSRARNPLHWL